MSFSDCNGQGTQMDCSQRNAGKAFFPEVLEVHLHKASLTLRSHIRCWFEHEKQRKDLPVTRYLC